ncbi:MAG: ATP-binding protein [Synergistaceae bacterium]|nr:ATP-binding protein [Synergistaceae bacterium]
MNFAKMKAKLPIGIQTFDIIRSEGYLYVDKTKYLIDLIDSGRVYFLSRPRRFGKSLTISTFDAIFSGKRELFEGLYASEFFERPEYKTHPVVRLDMSNLTTDMGSDNLRSSILNQVMENADRLHVNIETTLPGDALSNLLSRAAQKYNATTAVLIDEYDKPILDSIHDIEKAEAVRDILRNFYARIKAADRHLCFVFITGISKFSKVGVFSAMNNLTDISMNDKYAAMLGYTESELLSCFDAHIGDTAADMSKSKECLCAEIREHYDGFSFDGKTRLYNPFSVLNFFNDPTFNNYWFASGTPSVLVEYAKRHDLETENFRGLEVSKDFTSVAEIERASPESFLFQSGYLTVRERKGRNLILDYPNNEVLSSVADLFLYGKYKIAGISATQNNLERALGNGQPEELIKIYNSLLANLPYDIYEREERKYNAMKEKKDDYAPPPYAESFYHALLFTLLWSSRVNTTAENHSYWGRSDIEAEKNGHRYVVELKVADGKDAAKSAAADAMKQIHEKGYADKYAQESVTLIAIAVDRERRRVAEFIIVRS